MLFALRYFILRGVEMYGVERFLKFAGDATHGETTQRLRNMVIGFAGEHFHTCNWCTTVVPCVFVAISL